MTYIHLNENEKEIARRLRLKGFSEQKIGELMGISHTTISNIVGNTKYRQRKLKTPEELSEIRRKLSTRAETHLVRNALKVPGKSI